MYITDRSDKQRTRTYLMRVRHTGETFDVAIEIAGNAVVGVQRVRGVGKRRGRAIEAIARQQASAWIKSGNVPPNQASNRGIRASI